MKDKKKQDKQVEGYPHPEGERPSFAKRTAPQSQLLMLALGNFVMLACFFYMLSACIDENRMDPIGGLFTILISSTLVLLSVFVIILLIRPHFKFVNQTNETKKRITKDWYTFEKGKDFVEYYNSSPSAREAFIEKMNATYVLFFSAIGFFVGLIGYMMCSMSLVDTDLLFIFLLVFLVVLLSIEFLFYSIYKLIIET